MINKLQKEYSLISMISANLTNYYKKIRTDVSSEYLIGFCIFIQKISFSSTCRTPWQSFFVVVLYSLCRIDSTEELDSEKLLPDGRFNHTTQIQERLNFIKYLLKEGRLWLCSSQAESVWICLAQNSVFESDRENCFRWFSKLMTDESDLEPDMNKSFFENYVTQLDPKLLTDSGIK